MGGNVRLCYYFFVALIIFFGFQYSALMAELGEQPANLGGAAVFNTEKKEKVYTLPSGAPIQRFQRKEQPPPAPTMPTVNFANPTASDYYAAGLYDNASAAGWVPPPPAPPQMGGWGNFPMPVPPPPGNDQYDFLAPPPPPPPPPADDYNFLAEPPAPPPPPPPPPPQD